MFIDIKSLVYGAIGVFVFFFWILPILQNPLNPTDKYANAQNLINECKTNENELKVKTTELQKIKDTNYYKENKELKSDLSFYRFIYPWLWVMFILISIPIILYGINKYQTNKINELKEKLAKGKK